MIEFAVSGILRVLPHDWKGIKVYGCTGHGGKLGVGDWPTVHALEKPDVWLLNFDVWALGPAIAQTGIKYAIYPPIDHDPLPPPWLESLKGAFEIVPYCEFGRRVIWEGLGMVYPVMNPIPHGVDTKIFRPMEVSKSEVFGRETPQDTFVVGIFKNNQGTRAKYELQLEGFRMFLDHVGDNSPRLYLHTSKVGHQAFDIGELVRRFNLSGHVYLVGPQRYWYGLSDEDLAKTYNACDVLLNCVAGEGWGLPITEAFACGKPVIATAFSSMTELLTGVEGEIEKRVWDKGECIETERGWLVPTSGSEFTLGKRSTRRVFRPEDVAAALTEAYEHPDKRKAMGEAAHKWVQRFDWSRVGDQWIEYLDGLEKRIMPKRYSWKPIETRLEEPSSIVSVPSSQSDEVAFRSGLVPMRNKTACVVFSFNRPNYLVPTLDSLSKNTRADECDWYFYQDGWKNNPEYPYVSEKDEIECQKRVQQCVEVLEGFPFKHKQVIAKEQNVCIGRQLQEAKAELFKKYDNVIFFDDDHIVSKDYIDVLLKMHKQYPDAIVGAQATGEKHVPRDATLDQVGVTVKQISGMIPRPGRWRWIAYLLPKAIHKATVKQMDEYMTYIGPSYRNIPHHSVRIKYGVTITGFDGVMEKFCEKKKIKRIATVIPRGRYIGESGLFGNPQLFKQLGFSQYAKYEFDESTVKEFRVYGEPVIKIVEVNGHKMLLDPHDKLEGADPWVVGLMKARVKEGDTVLDLGANIGFYTLLLSDLVGLKGKVFAFEPDPTNFGILEKNVAGCENVVLVHKAVSDKTGKAKLYLNKVNLGDHRLCPAHKGQEAIDIRTITLDAYFIKKLKPVNFIKLDVQGAEGGAVKGMGKLIAASANVEMVAEYAPRMMEESGIGPKKFLALLAEQGFELWGVRGLDRAFPIDKPIKPLDTARLLTDYSVEEDHFTDLWFVKHPKGGENETG